MDCKHCKDCRYATRLDRWNITCLKEVERKQLEPENARFINTKYGNNTQVCERFENR